MNALEQMDKKALKELLSKGWLTHDAMWFALVMRELGVERANELNKAAVVSMSAFEVRRLKKALGFGESRIESFAELGTFLDGAFDLLIPDFMRFRYSMDEHNVLRWEWEKDECFAYKGVKRLGIPGQYRCGVMLRVESWLTGLGVAYTMEPSVDLCLMHTRGECRGTIRFCFEEPEAQPAGAEGVA